jgi:hypothetical protein
LEAGKGRKRVGVFVLDAKFLACLLHASAGTEKFACYANFEFNKPNSKFAFKRMGYAKYPKMGYPIGFDPSAL